MKWKDSDEMNENEEKTEEEYFDEERYSPWSNAKSPSKGRKPGMMPLVFILLGLAVIASVSALLIILLSNDGDAMNRQQFVAMEEKVRQLEERLDKFEAIDEKVTRIWEQAKSFEKFKDRFDRTEASMSLRMDHLTMSLEALQKQVSKPRPATSKPAAEKAQEQVPEATGQKMVYHTVSAGDTYYSISKRYNLELEKLLSMNGLKKDSILQPGQKLIVRILGEN